MALLSIDIGGTSVKHALFEAGKLREKGSFVTPKTLEALYNQLTALVDDFKQAQTLDGVAISSPGAVDKQTGIIEGMSALPYIHGFDIHSAFEARFGLPVSIENDANCAALAEITYGAAKGLSDVLFLVLGTGVGGAVVVNGQIHHGKHLFGGEFGLMLMDERHTFSDLGTAVEMAKRYKKRTGRSLSGQEVFGAAFAGDMQAKEEMQTFVHTVAKGIYNLQYAFDPECVVIGGGVSQANWLIPALQDELRKILAIVEIAPISPEILPCYFRNDANLIGAAVDFERTFGM